jgi:hypothetical protein
VNRPLCSRRNVRQGKHFGKQGKSCFPKDYHSLTGDKHNALRKALWLLHFSGGRQKTLLGVPRALSEAGGSFFS